MKFVLSLLIPVIVFGQIYPFPNVPYPHAGGGGSPTFIIGSSCVMSGTSCSMGWTVTAGHGIIVCAGSQVAVGNALSVADTLGNTYNAGPLGLFTDVVSNTESECFVALNVTGGAVTIGCGRFSSGGTGLCTGAEYSNLALSASGDKGAGAANSSVTAFVSGTTATTTQLVELLSGFFFSVGSPTTCTAANGYVVRESVGTGNPFACQVDKNSAATGTFQASTTMNASGSGVGTINTFK